MWRIPEVFASMAGIPPLLDESSAALRKAGEQASNKTTIMKRMKETPVRRKKKRVAKVHAGKRANNFSAEYFKKFYLNPETRVVTAGEMRTRAGVIACTLSHCEIPVRRILDAGCGIGLLRAPFKEFLPRARYTGLEASEYLCGRFGWVRGSVADYAPRQPFDLVVCYDVLQYLSDADAAAAIANMRHLSRAAVYVSALTTEDWRENCDRARTDGEVHLRSGAWYRRRLKRSFRYIGFGIWVRKDVSAILWDLERP
jgi:2-polyprenyl-3-methyl-5-hydroxy-6-metoxy-1,4-benzoquinol methylase